MQGFGDVGRQTAEWLVKEGVKLVVTDTYEAALDRALGVGATVVEPDAIYEVECDIVSPCALGGVLSSDTMERVIHDARLDEVPTSVAADRLAERRLEEVRRLRGTYRGRPRRR